jgi:glycerate 2-kinase
MYDAAVAAAHPGVVLAQHLPSIPKGRVICLAAGKGAAAMAAAAEAHYLDRERLDPARLVGIATTRHGHGVPTRRIRVVEAGHPMPDEAGLKGADDTLRLAATAEPGDLLLVLLTGGGSANWIAPADGIAFEQKQKLTRALLRSGAPIGEINTVRKHLSRIKGGRLARAGQRASAILTLAVSDVPRDDSSAIASGPTVPDPTTLADARAIVAKYRLEIDDAIRRALDNPANESCKAGDPAFAHARFELIARPQQSLEAAVKLARDNGYETIELAELEGEAREVAADHARLALEARARGKRVAILSGGELTVTVRGNGRGGPNQEYALALADLLKGTSDISAIAGDTDGADGGAGSASDPAGALVDSATFAKMKSQKLDPRSFLENNDATAFFAATGDLLQTGPTLTNVNDIRVILVD